MDELSLDDIDATDKEIVRLKWQYPKISYSEIGKLLGISKQAAHARALKPKIKNIIDGLAKDILLQMKDAQRLAVQVLIQTLKSNDEGLRYKAARDLLQKVLDSSQLLPQSIEHEVLEFIDPGEEVLIKDQEANDNSTSPVEY